MKIITSNDCLEIQFPAVGHSTVHLADVHQVDLETIPTMTVDVDLISLGFQNGEFLEITDEADGFRDAAEYLSIELSIAPSILERFPIHEGQAGTIWKRE